MPDSNKLEDYYIIKDGKKLRYGYTTGSCAAAAAKVATMLLCNPGIKVTDNKYLTTLLTPKGILLELSVLVKKREANCVCCSVIKDGGDDPDVTHGLEICVTVQRSSTLGIRIDGGTGVGRVTKEGLDQPIGNAAINSVPRRMIFECVEEILKENNYSKGIEVCVEVPRGEEIAKRTFNPRLGIVGGISILGTSGIVVPMSEEALIKSIEVEIKMLKKRGEKYVLVTPGNYGESFLVNHNIVAREPIKCSNYIGKTMELAVQYEMKGVLLVGHIGKLIKVSGGIMNTHSKEADARLELLMAHAMRAGADLEVCKRILEEKTCDAALGILQREGLLSKTMQIMMEKTDFYLHTHVANAIEIGVITFSNVYGELGMSKHVENLCEQLRRE